MLKKGREVLSKVKGCPVGWIKFTCKYPKPNVTYESIDLVNPKETIRSALKNVWENKGRVFLYHDPINKNLKVAINQTEREDFWNYTCKFNQLPDSCDTVELDLDVETDGCQGQCNQTAYRTAKTTITCNYTGNKYKFFCKENGSICEDILSTKPSVKSNGTFTLTETNSSFSMSISNVSSHDAGVYWCGVETHEGSYRTALRKIQLEVNVLPTVSPQTLSTSLVTSPQSTTARAESHGAAQVVFTVIVCVAVLLPFVLILICKRFSHLKNTRSGAAAQRKEDHVYQEIQQHIQMPDSGNKTNPIYATVNFPTNPSALHYCTINFQSSSDRVGGEALIVKPSSAACKCFIVKQNPTYCTITQSSSSSEEPLYATIN